MQSDAETPEEYLAELDPGRQTAIAAVREHILRHLPPGYAEEMQFGMISYVVPLERFPDTYNGRPLMYAALASQKNYMSLYLTNVYGDAETESWFAEQYRASGKRLDMGKSCVRFRTLADLPLELIDEVIAKTSVDEFLSIYAKARSVGR